MNPSGLAVGEGALWVTNQSDATLSRIDLRRGTVTDTIAVATFPEDVVTGAGAVWVFHGTRFLVERIDPMGLKVSDRIAIDVSGRAPLALALELGGIAIGEGAVWAAVVTNESAGGQGYLFRIDPTTREAERVGVAGAVGNIAVGQGYLWTVDHDTPGVDVRTWTGRPPSYSRSASRTWVASPLARALGRRGLLQ